MSETLKSTRRLNSINWNELVEYSEEVKTCLCWKYKRRGRNNSLVNHKNNGEAGSETKEGFLSLSYEKNQYSIPKIIWIIKNGAIPDGFSVYFKDDNCLNPKIENLYIKETHVTFTEKYSKELKNYLKYSTLSPSCLLWKDKASKSSTISKGDTAGSLDNSDGYWKIHGLGNHYKAHRVVWFLHYGKIPEKHDIDHLNGTRSDNRIENLRVVPRVLNARNRTLGKNNKTGYNMIAYKETFTRKGTPISSYVVCLYKETLIRTSKSFSCLKYGKEKALELAIKWRDERLANLNSQGFGYTERHGTKK